MGGLIHNMGSRASTARGTTAPQAAESCDMSDLQVSDDLMQLVDASTSQQQRSAPFSRLRDHFAPVTNQSASYANALEQLFAQRFDLWPPRDSKLDDEISGSGDAAGADAEEAANSNPLGSARQARLADQVRGCIFGAALGDAVG